MPKVTITEHAHASPSKHQVWSAENLARLNCRTKPAPPDGRAKRALGDPTFAFVRAHHIRRGYRTRLETFERRYPNHGARTLRGTECRVRLIMNRMMPASFPAPE